MLTFRSDKVPLMITMILMAVGMAGFLGIRLMYMYENKRRIILINDWTEHQFEEEARSVKRRGDQRYTFIYGL